MPGCVPHRSRRPTTDVLIAQLTDPHVMRAGTNRRFMGDTAGHLARAVAWLAARTPRPAAVVVSGDLVDRADPQEYDRLRDVLAGLPMPYYVVPGNHDRSQRVRETFAGHGFAAGDGKLHYTVEDHDVRIVGLDSTLRLRSGGYLDAADLAWLDAALGRAPDRPTLLCLHHPPFHTGMRYMDAFGFVGLAGLHDLLDRHRQVKLSVSGHVHRAFSTRVHGTAMWTSVSTAPQIVPELFERRPFWLRFERPGLSLHEWVPSAGAFASRLYCSDGDGYAEAPRLITTLVQPAASPEPAARRSA